MFRIISLAAALAAGMSAAAFASDTRLAIKGLFSETQARQHLLHQGYTNVSELSRDAHGNWTGVATTKDGQVRAVSVDIKVPASDIKVPASPGNVTN